MYLVKDLNDKKYKTAKKIEIWASNDNSEDQILTEVSFLKTLNHPHILKYYDICL
jgi:serine/threonine protein kinase